MARVVERVRAHRTREAGQVLVIFVFALITLMGATGLAFDIGRFYMERRFLQNAADAAALAAGRVLVDGGTTDAARLEARAVLARNYASPPNGVVPAMPPPTGSEVYESGHAGEGPYLVDGIRISGVSVRVAVRNTIPYTFGRALGFDDNVITARARVKFEGDLLPIAVRRYIKAPGNDTGVAPCLDDFTQFMDFFATANTACLGTDTDDSDRIDPSPGLAFDAANPDNDRTRHGPIVEILGQGADPDNGADFRGFVALDIRNFATSSSQLYYNAVTPATTANTLKDMQAAWILNGGYPGPMFPPVTYPPDPNDQVAILSGNSTGAGIDAFADRFTPGDEILVGVYPGVTMQIPDFSMTSPSVIPLGESGDTSSAGSIRVSRNQAFFGQVTLETLPDAADPANPLVLGTIDSVPPVTYTPNPVTPTMGSGTTVEMQDVHTSGATPGIYAAWLRGQAGSPYLTTKYTPFAFKVGTVSKDFVITSNATEQTAATTGATVSFTLNVKRSGGPFGGTGVTLSLEQMPGAASMPTGFGSYAFSPANVTPTNGSGTNSTLTINTGTMASGIHQFVVRATGTNGDGRPVTKLMILQVNVATSSAGGNQEYVDIVGFAVMRVASITSNTVYAYAITPVIDDLQDSRLRRGQVARLSPWTTVN
ncbi:MAG TPA: pilus assembly protein TadG-related protein [Candidatus Limnocylindrales bacterium]|nr:pilus assembly protein TadG-related protein [Candidatus Limnocylindrales bacterium]